MENSTFNDPVALYVHFPHCLKKCPYCDFYSTSFLTFEEGSLYESYIKELQYFEQTVGPRPLSSLYFGGGTPSLMPISLFERMMEQISFRYKKNEKIETTLEANPKTLDLAKMKAFKATGINRLSIGAQALNNKDLKELGRIHTVKDTLKILNHAANEFETYSADFIFGRPDQTVSMWEKELKDILKLNIPHLSFYQLTLHDNYQVTLPSDEIQTEMLKLTRDVLKTEKYEAYEVSNFAKFGHRSKHNVSYWYYDEFIGIGPSASSRFILDKKWYERKDGKTKKLSSKESQIERLLMGLRCADGVNPQDINEVIDHDRCRFLEQQKMIERNGLGKIVVTEKGIPYLDAITEKLIK